MNSSRIKTDSVSVPRKIFVLTVVVVGVFFRFYNIDHKLLWHDEVYTQLFAAGIQAREWRSIVYTGQPIDVSVVQALARNRPDRGVTDTIRGLAEDEPQHPPVYYILARAFVALFGDGIGTLRIFTALCSLCALPAFFWLCREFFTSRRVAWNGLALLAVSPFFVLYAQEAREYALWSVFILLSNAALLKAVRRTTETASEQSTRPLQMNFASRRRLFASWTLFAMLTTLSLYISFSTATVIFSQILWLAFRERFRITRLILLSAGAFSVSGLLFLPWAWLLWRNLQAFSLSMAWSKITVIPRAELFSTLALNISRTIANDTRENGDILALIFVTLSVVLVASAMYAVYKNARRVNNQALVCFLFIVPILMLLIPDVLFGGIRSISGRYLTPAWIGVECALAFFSGSRILARPLRDTLLTAILFTGILSCYFNSQQSVVWTKGISSRLPEVAAMINRETDPLIVGDFERHHPGNLLALSHLLKPGSKMQFLATHDEAYRLPFDFQSVFLYSPIPEFRATLKDHTGRHARSELLLRGLYLDLWRVNFARFRE